MTMGATPRSLAQDPTENPLRCSTKGWRKEFSMVWRSCACSVRQLLHLWTLPLLIASFQFSQHCEHVYRLGLAL